jgi:hypothetical protein
MFNHWADVPRSDLRNFWLLAYFFANWRVVLIGYVTTLTLIFRGLIFLVKKCEIVGIFLLARGFGFFKKPIVGAPWEHCISVLLNIFSPRWVLVVFIRGRFFSVTDAFVALISSKNVMVWATTVTDVVGLMTWMTRSIFLSDLILAKGGGSWGHTSLASGVSSALVYIVRDHFWKHVFPLTNLWTIFHTVCLLNKEHVSMILRSFHNFWSGSSILHIDPKTLVGLRALRSVMIVLAHVVRTSTLPLVVALIVFRAWWGPISSPKPSKSGRIHLLLKKVTWVRIMDIRVILEPLDKTLLVVCPVRMVVELGHSTVVVGTAVGILRKLSLTVL